MIFRREFFYQAQCPFYSRISLWVLSIKKLTIQSVFLVLSERFALPQTFRSPDLQSGAIDYSANSARFNIFFFSPKSFWHLFEQYLYGFLLSSLPQKRQLFIGSEPTGGFEPSTFALQKHCSTTELCRRCNPFYQIYGEEEREKNMMSRTENQILRSTRYFQNKYCSWETESLVFPLKIHSQEGFFVDRSLQKYSLFPEIFGIPQDF